MKTHYDVIVIGVGSMGAATCSHLAKRNVSVLGLEQFDIPHNRGAHHGLSRMIRQSYYEHSSYVPLLKRAYELWHELEDETECQLLTLNGGLYIGPADGEIVKGSLQSALDHNLPHQHLDRAAIADRFPQFSLPDDFEALYEENAGFVVPELAVGSHVELALRHGAELHGHEAVIDWSTNTSGVTVTTDQSTYQAGHLVITAGAWSARLLESLGIPLTVTRQVLGWTTPKQQNLFTPERFPCWFIESEPGFGHYGFPILPGQPGFKSALHKPATIVDPDKVERAPLPEDESTIRTALASYIPDANGPLLALRTCLYTNSPDSHFIIDHAPDHHDRLTLATGFSGHGFKFAPVVGEILADLATKGNSLHSIDLFSLKRFA